MDLVRIKPGFEQNFSCPECESMDTVVSKISVPGTHWLADCVCNACGFGFLQSLPIGHSIDYQIAVGKENQRVYRHGGKEHWLSGPFLDYCTLTKSADVAIRKQVYSEHKRVIILNTLDFLYGHTLLKLYNSQYHLDNQSDLGLIVIIPRAFEWLIPRGCAEAWIVDLRLSELFYSYDAIDRFVQNEWMRFDEVFASLAYSHPDYTAIDISRLSGVQPFNLEEFFRKKPSFTFALREDRLWYANRFGSWVHWLCKKLKRPGLARRFLARRQNSLVKKTIRHIREALPEAEIFVTGLGKTGSLAGWASDKRHERITMAIEREWCEIYARTHVVIGIHGSNMLLPTAFAAGCIEILPQSRAGNIVQDISVRYNDRRQLFFYRFVDQFASPRSVAYQAVSIINEYDNFHKNMICYIYR